ncbi:hypothetical protein CRG98_021498 [Punica granatum]|uniref:Uncharacterized protein n=1 Tax=Punica granatum TaxID=22663 RepID=A0A2I0JP99_PUNGR|nr:hypothetical protein CRG98_021498 [Punica granatum]
MNLNFWCKVEGTAPAEWIRGLLSSKLKAFGMSMTWKVTLNEHGPTSIRRTIWINPINLGKNDHHGHLEGSLGYPGPPTLLQNFIGSLRGDVRPDLCQSGQDTEDLSRSLPGRPTGSLAFSGFSHNPGRSRELVDTGYRPR